MPEGDTIFRTARTLRRTLQGRRLRRLRSPLPEIARAAEDLTGRRVVAVEARGKNLLFRFDGGPVLHTHLMMSGSWHVYRPGESWRKPTRRARVVLETDDAVAVCFSAPVVQLMSALQARHHRSLARLGPDLLAGEVDLDEILRRLRSREELAIGEALMTQSLVAGIGNVYKSETLFVRGVDPFAAVAELDDDALRGLARTARDLMRRNLEGFRRRTRFGADGYRYWVYGRTGQPCLRCGTRIGKRRQGDSARSTYFCPACQGVAMRVDKK